MKTLIIGASTKPERYAFKAANALLGKNHEIVLVGIRAGEVAGNEILLGLPEIKDVDTVTLYVGPKNQVGYYDYIVDVIKPRRIIFNPGTENQELESLAQSKGILTEVACTLVLLSIGNY